jgi:hypothetical protein
VAISLEIESTRSPNGTEYWKSMRQGKQKSSERQVLPTSKMKQLAFSTRYLTPGTRRLKTRRIAVFDDEEENIGVLAKWKDLDLHGISAGVSALIRSRHETFELC